MGELVPAIAYSELNASFEIVKQQSNNLQLIEEFTHPDRRPAKYAYKVVDKNNKVHLVTPDKGSALAAFQRLEQAFAPGQAGPGARRCEGLVVRRCRREGAGLVLEPANDDARHGRSPPPQAV